MRIIIYILIFVASMFCFHKAEAQGGVSTFGANSAQDTSKTKGQIVGTAYSNANNKLFLTTDTSGHFILDTIDAAGTHVEGWGIIINGDTIAVDSGDLSTIYVQLGDSTVIFVTPTQLATAIANIDFTGIRDTAAALYDSLSLKVPYSDSNNWLPTKTFLLNNYFKNGGNSFGVAGDIGTKDAFPLNLRTNNTVRATIFSNGNVGIGTTTDAGFKLDVNGTFRAIGNSTIRGTLTVDNITNSDLIQVVTTGGNPYLRFLDAGFFIADLKTTVAVPTVSGAGLTISDGGSGFLSFRAGKMLASNGHIAITSGDAAGPAFLELSGSTNNFIRFIEAGAADRGIVGYADASNIMQFRVGGATSPTTGTLSMSLLNNGRVLLSQVPEYADNAAAILGGLAVGTIYRTGDILKIVH